jgi:hypothetical protein
MGSVIIDQFLQASPVAGGIMQLYHGDELVLPGVRDEIVESLQICLGPLSFKSFVICQTIRTELAPVLRISAK